MTEARTVEQFVGLRDDLKLLALGAYIAELTEDVADEDRPNTELLPLCLNALYALSEKLKTPEFVKPVFELRLMAISGFEPMLTTQGDGSLVSRTQSAYTPHESNSIVSLEDGVLKLSTGAFNAAKYVLDCDAKKLFSFTLSDEALKELSRATENYLLAHLDRTFRTLDYYHKI